MDNWLENFAPDISATLKRFPFAILLAALGTLLAIALVNEWLLEDAEPWLRLDAGLFGGAVYATAGALFIESRPRARLAGVLLRFLAPLLVVALLQVSDTGWVVSPVLPFLGLLWLSVAPFTQWGSGTDRVEIQNRFWWMNHRAITTAIISAMAFGLIAVGLIAIERALITLFNLRTGRVFYQYLLPFTGLFLTPLYWLSTLPHLAEYSPDEMDAPDFLSRAIGFLGQFILVPFLFIYALILLAYAAQIAFTLSLPQGMLGWMVLGFTIVGAATWLVLHPSFTHKSRLVRQFRRWWFWLTIVPLALYAMAVYLRIDAYGLTAERMGLVAGGLWAGTLTLMFLTRRFADIRIIPALAAGLVLILSVGPWNFINLPLLHQALRLDAAIYNARPATQSLGGPYTWTKEAGEVARGAINYLVIFDAGQQMLRRTLAFNGIELKDDEISSSGKVFSALELQSDVIREGTPVWQNLKYPANGVFDTSRTPFFLGNLRLGTGYRQERDPLKFEFMLDTLRISDAEQNAFTLDLMAWKDDQDGEKIIKPGIDFVLGSVTYQLVVLAANFRLPGGEGVPWEATDMEVLLFASADPDLASSQN